MKTNTHDQNQINLTTIAPLAQGVKPRCDRLLLEIHQHATDLRVVRRLEDAGPQPPQRVYPGADLERFVNGSRCRGSVPRLIRRGVIAAR